MATPFGEDLESDAGARRGLSEHFSRRVERSSRRVAPRRLLAAIVAAEREFDPFAEHLRSSASILPADRATTQPKATKHFRSNPTAAERRSDLSSRSGREETFGALGRVAQQFGHVVDEQKQILIRQRRAEQYPKLCQLHQLFPIFPLGLSSLDRRRFQVSQSSIRRNTE